MRSTSVDNIERKQKREARLVNKFPLNQAALRWLKEVEKDDDLCDAGEIDTEAHVVTYLVWALEWLRGQELLDDWRAEWMQEEQTSLFEISPSSANTVLPKTYFSGTPGGISPHTRAEVE